MSAPAGFEPVAEVTADERSRIAFGRAGVRSNDRFLVPAHTAKLKKVTKARRLLRDVGPAHPGLNSHKYQSLTGPHGEEVWESSVENRTPGAWRLWWVHGPEADTLTIATMNPHP